MNSMDAAVPIDDLLEAMNLSGVFAELDVHGTPKLNGPDAANWQGRLTGRQDELIEALGGAGTDDLQDVDHRYMRDLMRQYGISEPWTCKQLDEAEITTNYLVDGVLVEGQHAIIAGASKSMKTSIAIDLALSLAKPDRFLAKFWVPEAKRVLFLSAESGEGTIQETARRVAESKGFWLSACTNVHWGFWVPRAKSQEQLAVLEYQLDQSGADVVVIDPLYQCLSGEDMANLSMNGEQLQAIVGRCKQRGVTAVLVDHVKRGSTNANTFQPLELNDVSGAGKAEFFRQWLLIGRRERFDPEHALHRLWLTVGGSAGHCGLYAVDIDETRDVTTEARQWVVNAEKGSSAKVDDAKQRAEARAAKKEAEKAEKLEKNVAKIRETFKDTEPWTRRKIRAHADLSNEAAATALAKLMQLGEIEEGKAKTNGGTYGGYRWTRLAPINQD
ncbi:hypothetical protein FF011L_36750 [Roseimaritima multifibrata]|uniref:Uncharacterized protein n=1 Tax=Roseimaritima multifibrata TaxID=1930274 RepID=A0A517MJ37_9BACT|nr:AAA family ATPase [Roseimaritima multifibrata]QDS94893.1 hypothetical protein FF011L_36750 [Roseimaritima multifibrata]